MAHCIKSLNTALSKSKWPSVQVYRKFNTKLRKKLNQQPISASQWLHLDSCLTSRHFYRSLAVLITTVQQPSFEYVLLAQC